MKRIRHLALLATTRTTANASGARVSETATAAQRRAFQGSAAAQAVTMKKSSSSSSTNSGAKLGSNNSSNSSSSSSVTASSNNGGGRRRALGQKGLASQPLDLDSIRQQLLRYKREMSSRATATTTSSVGTNIAASIGNNSIALVQRQEQGEAEENFAQMRKSDRHDETNVTIAELDEANLLHETCALLLSLEKACIVRGPVTEFLHKAIHVLMHTYLVRKLWGKAFQCYQTLSRAGLSIARSDVFFLLQNLPYDGSKGYDAVLRDRELFKHGKPKHRRFNPNASQKDVDDYSMDFHRRRRVMKAKQQRMGKQEVATAGRTTASRSTGKECQKGEHEEEEQQEDQEESQQTAAARGVRAKDFVQRRAERQEEQQHEERTVAVPGRNRFRIYRDDKKRSEKKKMMMIKQAQSPTTTMQEETITTTQQQEEQQRQNLVTPCGYSPIALMILYEQCVGTIDFIRQPRKYGSNVLDGGKHTSAAAAVSSQQQVEAPFVAAVLDGSDAEDAQCAILPRRWADALQLVVRNKTITKTAEAIATADAKTTGKEEVEAETTSAAHISPFLSPLMSYFCKATLPRQAAIVFDQHIARHVHDVLSSSSSSPSSSVPRHSLLSGRHCNAERVQELCSTTFATLLRGRDFFALQRHVLPCFAAQTQQHIPTVISDDNSNSNTNTNSSSERSALLLAARHVGAASTFIRIGKRNGATTTALARTHTGNSASMLDLFERTVLDTRVFGNLSQQPSNNISKIIVSKLEPLLSLLSQQKDKQRQALANAAFDALEAVMAQVLPPSALEALLVHGAAEETGDQKQVTIPTLLILRSDQNNNNVKSLRLPLVLIPKMAAVLARVGDTTAAAASVALLRVFTLLLRTAQVEHSVPQTQQQQQRREEGSSSGVFLLCRKPAEQKLSSKEEQSAPHSNNNMKSEGSNTNSSSSSSNFDLVYEELAAFHAEQLHRLYLAALFRLTSRKTSVSSSSSSRCRTLLLLPPQQCLELLDGYSEALVRDPQHPHLLRGRSSYSDQREDTARDARGALGLSRRSRIYASANPFPTQHQGTAIAPRTTATIEEITARIMTRCITAECSALQLPPSQKELAGEEEAFSAIGTLHRGFLSFVSPLLMYRAATSSDTFATSNSNASPLIPCVCALLRYSLQAYSSLLRSHKTKENNNSQKKAEAREDFGDNRRASARAVLRIVRSLDPSGLTWLDKALLRHTVNAHHAEVRDAAAVLTSSLSVQTFSHSATATKKQPQQHQNIVAASLRQDVKLVGACTVVIEDVLGVKLFETSDDVKEEEKKKPQSPAASPNPQQDNIPSRPQQQQGTGQIQPERTAEPAATRTQPPSSASASAYSSSSSSSSLSLLQGVDKCVADGRWTQALGLIWDAAEQRQRSSKSSSNTSIVRSNNRRAYIVDAVGVSTVCTAVAAIVRSRRQTPQQQQAGGAVPSWRTCLGLYRECLVQIRQASHAPPTPAASTTTVSSSSSVHRPESAALLSLITAIVHMLRTEKLPPVSDPYNSNTAPSSSPADAADIALGASIAGRALVFGVDALNGLQQQQNEEGAKQQQIRWVAALEHVGVCVETMRCMRLAGLWDRSLALAAALCAPAARLRTTQHARLAESEQGTTTTSSTLPVPIPVPLCRELLECVAVSSRPPLWLAMNVYQHMRNTAMQSTSSTTTRDGSSNGQQQLQLQQRLWDARCFYLLSLILMKKKRWALALSIAANDGLRALGLSGEEEDRGAASTKEDTEQQQQQTASSNNNSVAANKKAFVSRLLHACAVGGAWHESLGLLRLMQQHRMPVSMLNYQHAKHAFEKGRRLEHRRSASNNSMHGGGSQHAMSAKDVDVMLAAFVGCLVAESERYNDVDITSAVDDSKNKNKNGDRNSGDSDSDTRR